MREDLIYEILPVVEEIPEGNVATYKKNRIEQHNRCPILQKHHITVLSHTAFLRVFFMGNELNPVPAVFIKAKSMNCNQAL